jgi:hypothetical protein
VRKSKLALVYAVAYGRGEFPLDMLRYDRAFPASEDQSHRMGDPSRGLRVVIVARYLGETCWTEARWSSFGWSIRTFDSLSAASDYARSLPEDGPEALKSLLRF